MATTNKAKKSKKKIAIIAGIVVLVLVVCASPFLFFGASKDATIYVRKGATMEALQDSITKNVDASYASKVMMLLRVTGADMSKRHGAFKITKGESPLRAARHLRGGMPSGIKFTFNNIRTKQELIDRVGSLYMAGKAEFEKALNSYDVCAKFGRTPDNIVMIFIPDSYEFMWDITPDEMLQKMNENYNKFWNDDRKAKAAQLGLTPDEVEIIASITEEETIKADERGKVGRLYINRFKAGMRLQADPTVKFAIGDFSIKRLTREMLMTQSPYNTYRVNGLPPGPIRLPEKSTIDAILNSEPHNYMYMCAKSDFSGYHDFTTDYNAHLNNAHKYQDELDKNNIK